MSHASYFHFQGFDDFGKKAIEDGINERVRREEYKKKMADVQTLIDNLTTRCDDGGI